MVPFDFYSYCRRVRSFCTLYLQVQIRPFSTFVPTTASADFLVDIPSPRDVGSPLWASVRISPGIFASYPSDLRGDIPFQHRANQLRPALPVVPLHIRFLYVGLMLCYRLPSSVCYLPDSAESLDLPLNGRSVDFHHTNTRALLGAPPKRKRGGSQPRFPYKIKELGENLLNSTYLIASVTVELF